MTRRLADGPTVAAAAWAIGDEREPFVLERSAPGASGNRFSILGFDPIDRFEVRSNRTDWLDRLAEHVGPPNPRMRNPGVPLVGGWVGFIAYEAGPALESRKPKVESRKHVGCTQPRDSSLPVVRFGLYDTLAVFDHGRRVWVLVAVDVAGKPKVENRKPNTEDRKSKVESRISIVASEGQSRGGKRERLDRLESLLRGAGELEAIDWSLRIATEPVARMSRAEYFARVARAKRYIGAGDIYQVNLTQRFTTHTRAPARDIYRRLRVTNPGAYSALLMYDGAAILCSSPELFLELRDGVITTRPIKGTRPRTDDSVMNAVRRRELIHSAKDGAELAMIVDLLRNDLGRVAEFGSVRVHRAADLETHPTVYHLAATITAQLRDGLGWSDVLRAGFPGGSITGCPKIRAMQIIDELEMNERSAYCGSIGYIGLDGSMGLNIAIRTMVLDRGRLHLYGGGAIVADSDAQAEYEETLAKTAGMMQALRARDPAEVGAGRTWGRSA